MIFSSLENSINGILPRPLLVSKQECNLSGAHVLYSTDRVVELARLSVIQLGAPTTKLLHSFSAVCWTLLTEKVEMVLLVETPEAPLLAFERDVVVRLAGEARVLLLTLRGVAVGPVFPFPAARAASPRLDQKTKADASRVGHATVGGLIGNERTYQLWANGNPLVFTKTEEALLWVLLRAPNRSAKISEMKAAMRNPQSPGSDNTLRQFVHRIRRKLADAGQPAVIVSRPNGYELLSPPVLPPA